MRRKWDILLLLIIPALGSISVSVIFSINPDLAKSQLIFWLMGLIILYITSLFNYKNWQRFAKILYIASIAGLLILPIFGESVRGSVRWIDLGFFRIQPSEVAKISTIILLAEFYFNRSAKELKNLLTSFVLILPPAILVLIQPDIGNALSFFAIWFGISYVSGFRLKHIIWAILVATVFALLSFQFLQNYQKERINSFINPEADPLGRGYNIIQSKIAVGSGQVTGRGLGYGSQSQLNFLPEAESDFIFASIGEQFGAIGAGLIVIFYFLMITRIMQLARNKERFAQLIVAGTISFLLLQFAVNVGMNMGLVPVTGITLPLVSYGGSSLITTLFLLGIIFAIQRRES